MSSYRNGAEPTNNNPTINTADWQGFMHDLETKMERSNDAESKLVGLGMNRELSAGNSMLRPDIKNEQSHKRRKLNTVETNASAQEPESDSRSMLGAWKRQQQEKLKKRKLKSKIRSLVAPKPQSGVNKTKITALLNSPPVMEDSDDDDDDDDIPSKLPVPTTFTKPKNYDQVDVTESYPSMKNSLLCKPIQNPAMLNETHEPVRHSWNSDWEHHKKMGFSPEKEQAKSGLRKSNSFLSPPAEMAAPQTTSEKLQNNSESQNTSEPQDYRRYGAEFSAYDASTFQRLDSFMYRRSYTKGLANGLLDTSEARSGSKEQFQLPDEKRNLVISNGQILDGLRDTLEFQPRRARQSQLPNEEYNSIMSDRRHLESDDWLRPQSQSEIDQIYRDFGTGHGDNQDMDNVQRDYQLGEAIVRNGPNGSVSQNSYSSSWRLPSIASILPEFVDSQSTGRAPSSIGEVRIKEEEDMGKSLWWTDNKGRWG